MPGNATISEATGQPIISTEADFSICIIGPSTLNAAGAGKVSTAYSSTAALVTDYGLGDMVDAACQAIAPTPGNPAPPPVCVYSTPATNAGTYGTINIAGVLGTAVPSNGNTAMSIPAGSNGVALPVASITVASTAGFPAAGLLWIGTIGAFVRYTSIDATHFLGCTGGIGTLATAQAVQSAVTGTYQPWMKIVVGGALGTTGMTADASLDGGRSTIRVNLGTALTYNFPASDGWSGGGNQATFTLGANAATFLAGDVFFANTVAPFWSSGTDLYAAGPPATGAFAALANSSQQFGVLIITEPASAASGWSASDFNVLTAGLNYGLLFDKRWSLIIRFRDPTAGETDAAYITAFQTFANANHDNRITCLAGSAWVTDAFSAHIYLRSFIASYVARTQSFFVVAGDRGERLAQNPGWVARGPLEGCSLVDTTGNLVGHDEATRGGIEAANGAPTGLGVALCYRRNAAVQGTYVSNRSTVMYNVLSTILTPMDRRVANAIESVSVGISLSSIGGADVFDPVTFLLDQDIADGLAGKIRKQLQQDYSKEIQNADDPNLVVIDLPVTVAGAQVKITGTDNVRFYGYTDNIALVFSASR